jgi:hypothetical protein
VLLKVVCLLMHWLFSLAVLVFRGDRAKSAEPLVLRHENAVLRRNAARTRYDPAGRDWFATLTRFVPRRHWAEVFPVTPATLLAWNRRLTARKYDASPAVWASPRNVDTLIITQFCGLACWERSGVRQSGRMSRCRDRIRLNSAAVPWIWSSRAALSAMWRRRWGLPGRVCTDGGIATWWTGA